jgi:hypothetical protein
MNVFMTNLVTVTLLYRKMRIYTDLNLIAKFNLNLIAKFNFATKLLSEFFIFQRSNMKNKGSSDKWFSNIKTIL